MNRFSGVLMPMSSLPSPHGIGTMGKCAYDFVDFLSAAGQKYWQLLPLGPTSYGDSPYASFSAYAGNPYYIDLDFLVKERLLKKSEIQAFSWGDDPTRVNYSLIFQQRFLVLRKAFQRGRKCLAQAFSRFREGKKWLDDYALYMAVKAFFAMACWTEWPDEAIRLRRPEAVAHYRELLAEDVEFYAFLQFLFFRQWEALRSYAHKKGIDFIGDIPIYVALDSADVWSEPHFFLLDENKLPTLVAGCPPDAFTEDGQLWGNPLYNWEAMKQDGYGWWIRRVDGAGQLYDKIRIDHFRGFESYWAVPYGDATAKNGTWMPGPGMSLVSVLSSWFPDLHFIAEDLGFMTEPVKKLLADSGFPGMKVLEFAFDSQGDSDYLPHNCHSNSLCYLGTHDNETVLGWLQSLNKKDRAFAQTYMHITEDEGWCWGMIRTGMATSSQLFIVQMQDLLELPANCRMNTPGSPYGNWQWRMLPGAAGKKLARKLRAYTKTYRRLPVPPVEEAGTAAADR